VLCHLPAVSRQQPPRRGGSSCVSPPGEAIAVRSWRLVPKGALLGEMQWSAVALIGRHCQLWVATHLAASRDMPG
jgi:hypothetical protein